MGLTNLPTSGRIYVDAQVIIYFVEQHRHFFPLVAQLWDPARTKVELVTSELSLLETAVLPLAHGDQALVNLFETTLQDSVQLVPVGRDVLRRAARLRAQQKYLRTPDAIHAATAMAQATSAFVTNDRRLSNVPGLPVALLPAAP